MPKDYLRRSLVRIVGWNLISLLFFITLTSDGAWAHKVNIFAYVEGNTVFTESYFNDGKRCVHSRITVLDATGEQVLEGMTNEEGEFSFLIPETVKTDLRIVLTAGMGHKSEYFLPAGEFLDSLVQGQDASVRVQKKTPPEEREMKEGIGGSAEEPDNGEGIQPAVEKALDRKLKPIIRSLAKIEQEAQKPSLTEVIGGIGYIFGIVGIILYFRTKYRK